MKLPRLDLNTGEILVGKALFEAKSQERYRRKYSPTPIDLDDLMERAGPLADAAKAEVEWSAISFWLSAGYDTSRPALADAGIPNDLARRSVHLVWDALRHETGWPNLSGKAVTPVLYSYSTDSQSEARQVAADVCAVWEKTGRPHVDTGRYKHVFECLTSAVRNGLIEPLPGVKSTAT